MVEQISLNLFAPIKKEFKDYENKDLKNWLEDRYPDCFYQDGDYFYHDSNKQKIHARIFQNCYGKKCVSVGYQKNYGDYYGFSCPCDSLEEAESKLKKAFNTLK